MTESRKQNDLLTSNEEPFTQKGCFSAARSFHPKAKSFGPKGPFGARFNFFSFERGVSGQYKAVFVSRTESCSCTSSTWRQTNQRRNHPKEPLKTAKMIELTWGKYAIVDAEDCDLLSSYKWCAVKKDQTWYAYTLTIEGKRLPMHRLIMDEPKGLFVDHRDHNGLNNRKTNLRLCTKKQNQENRRPNRGGTSKYKGVHWCNTYKKFRARICHNGKRIHLGYFEDEIEAAKAYDKKARELFGEFAYLNFPLSSRT